MKREYVVTLSSFFGIRNFRVKVCAALYDSTIRFLRRTQKCRLSILSHPPRNHKVQNYRKKESAFSTKGKRSEHSQMIIKVWVTKQIQLGYGLILEIHKSNTY